MTPEAMAALHASCFGAAPRPWTAAEFADLLAGPGTVALTRSGGLALIRVAGPEAELLTIAVDPARRRRGIGAALLGEALATASARGAAEMFLEVAAANAAARALYAAAGFAEVGCRPAYYRAPGAEPDDALVLRRGLTAAQNAAGNAAQNAPANAPVNSARVPREGG